MPDQTFDPRYRPEFQRGYDPSTAPERDAPASAGRAAETEPRASFTDAARRPHEARSGEPGLRVDRRPARASSEARADESTEAAADASMRATTDARRNAAREAARRAQPWRNPWLIVLLVGGILLVVGGIGAFRGALETMYAPRTTPVRNPEDIDWVGLQVWWTIGPFMAVAGILVLAGVLLFVAAWWARRDASDEWSAARADAEAPESTADGSAAPGRNDAFRDSGRRGDRP